VEELQNAVGFGFDDGLHHQLPALILDGTIASLCTSMPIPCGLPDYVEEVCKPSPDDLAEWRFEEPVHSLLNIVLKTSRRLKALEK
jgi:hypothetical protein